MGIYMVWPAFYTDVTDAYRLPRRDRLRIDLGGLYFNAIIAVATTGVWLAWHVDALLLLVAVQLIEMVKQLSPVIRSDGYHVLADATGVPDLYAHIGPTLKRLLPWKKNEPSALQGRARALVTIWVLVVVPVLLSLAIGAILLLPRLLTTAWNSGSSILSAIPHDVQHAKVIALLMALLRLLALLLPLVGSILMSKRILGSLAGAARDWSDGKPARRVVVVAAGAAAFCGSAWALCPAGQYQPVRPTDRGTLVAFTHVISSPAAAARPAAPAPAARAPLAGHAPRRLDDPRRRSDEEPSRAVHDRRREEPARGRHCQRLGAGPARGGHRSDDHHDRYDADDHDSGSRLR